MLLPWSPAALADEPPVDRRRGPEAIQPQTLGPATLWINPSEWTWVKSDRDDTLAFVHKTGLAQARLTWKPEPQPAEEALEAVREGVRQIAPEVEVVFQETRRINGVDTLCVQLRAISQKDKEVMYYGVLWSGEDASVRLFTIAGSAVLGVYYDDLTELLDGLEIRAAGQPQPEEQTGVRGLP